MINHFRTHLLNRPAAYFDDSLFSFYVDPAFVPAVYDEATQTIDDTLFGRDTDASLRNYRFAEFLWLIKACGLDHHTERFDRRKTYKLDQMRLSAADLFVSTALPAEGISIYAISDNAFHLDIRMKQRVRLSGTKQNISAFDAVTGERVLFDLLTSGDILFPALAAGVRGLPEALDHVLDVRNPSRRSVASVVESTLSLSQDVYHSLFRPLREDFPEYEQGFRSVTDTLHKFCMILFAQACVLEKRKP